MFNNFINFYHNLDKKFKIIFWVAFVDVLIIIAIAIFYFTYRLNNEPNNITITNWNEYASEVPDEFQKSIEYSIDNILTNFNNTNTESGFTATIRNDSYIETPSSASTERNVSFLVDLADIRQTYQVKFSYNTTTKQNGNYNVTVTCPLFSYLVYQNNCRTSDNPYDLLDLYYLPYDGELPSGKTISIRKRVYDSFQQHAKENYLAVSINSCDDPVIIQEGEDFIQNWFNTRFLDKNDYYLEILNLCE